MYLAVVTQRALKVSLVKPGDRNLIKAGFGVFFQLRFVCRVREWMVGSQNGQLCQPIKPRTLK